MARHAPLVFTVLAALAVAAASASAYARASAAAADEEGDLTTIIRVGDEEDDGFALGGGVTVSRQLRRRRMQDVVNGTSVDGNGTSTDGNDTTSTTSTYISYGALRADSVPCDLPGASYYNCRPGAEANPYTRGCSAITQCRG